MPNLSPGVNVALSSEQLRLQIRFRSKIRGEIGAVVLPSNEARRIVGQPFFIHEGQSPGCQVENETDDEFTIGINLNASPSNTTRLLVILYRYGAKGPLSIGQSVELRTEPNIRYELSLADVPAAALVLAEIYRRDSAWKIRALAESSAYGLAAFGRRLGFDLEERHPDAINGSSRGSQPQNWTGTGFVVAQDIFMTNAHVVDGARTIGLRSLQGNLTGEVMISDPTNDIALIRARNMPPAIPLVFRRGSAQLGEGVTTMGYPLASIMGSAIQVTQGGVSGLFGPKNDSRLIQFTAPIQPGSSGSPLIDLHGLVLGVVSGSFTNTQNMNFAVRSALALALLDAASIPCTIADPERSSHQGNVAASRQGAVWRIECEG